MKKKILAVLCVMGLLAGCTAGNAENTAPQEAQETLAQGEGESPAEEAESEEP
ncbi:MAG TPA: sugar ABC transporter substrate-binding protein, partial [Candidatus Merdisoma faecalis]|nr:sugar ABC transporter substrate-binding protein [Candidatus Merdisoma faecalis]